jgi:hypothetical protein
VGIGHEGNKTHECVFWGREGRRVPVRVSMCGRGLALFLYGISRCWGAGCKGSRGLPLSQGGGFVPQTRSAMVRLLHAPATVCRPRRPLESAFHSLVCEHFEDFPAVRPKCGGKMKSISFIEARQDAVIPKILENYGLWHDPTPRAPPKPPRPTESACAKPGRDSGPDMACDIDPDFIEHLRCEKTAEQLELPWDKCGSRCPCKSSRLWLLNKRRSGVYCAAGRPRAVLGPAITSVTRTTNDEQFQWIIQSANSSKPNWVP